jgi:cation diffusion facilitator CzcD-associated flavoprotein CzcO
MGPSSFHHTPAPAPTPARQPDAPHEVIVVGAGFAGIGAAIKLREAGCDFLVLEKADEIGGVWRDNTYPDCGCDVPSAFYSYSFAPNPRWSRLFAKQSEIKAYTRDTAERFGVLGHIRLGHELITARWDAPARLWRLKTTAGDYSAQFVIMACGPMHVPVLPRVPGLETFTGVSFHSSRWRHDIDLRDKRVAVIGTGASAIQFVPMIQRQVQQLSLFQRTPPWVLPKMDALISPRWQRLFEKIPWTQSLFRKLLYLQFELLNLSLKSPRLIKRLEAAGKKNIARGVKDLELRARLTPDFALGCKRILMSNTWYRALARSNVRVLPGVARVDGGELVADDGQRCAADVIIFATGFEVANPPIAERIVGASGKPLAELWQGSPAAYLGTMTPDCPNLFLTFGPNLYTFSSSFVMIEAQLKLILSAITSARQKRLATIAVNPAVYQRYNSQAQNALQRTVWNSGCSSYFLDKNGRNSTNWPWTTWTMTYRLRRFNVADFLVEPRA